VELDVMSLGARKKRAAASEPDVAESEAEVQKNLSTEGLQWIIVLEDKYCLLLIAMQRYFQNMKIPVRVRLKGTS